MWRGKEGGTKNCILGRLSRLNWGDRGREGGQKLGKMRRRLLWMIPYDLKVRISGLKLSMLD